MTTKKPLTSKDAIRFLTLLDAGLTNKQIADRLDWLGLPECTSFLIAQTRSSLREHVRFFDRVGLLRKNRQPLIPARIRRLKPLEDKPVRYHYGRQSKDD